VLGTGISLLAWQHRIGGTARGAAVAAAGTSRRAGRATSTTTSRS